jgi:hypothetical protein
MPDVISSANYGDRFIYIAILLNVMFFLLIINLVRKRYLSEQFALAWLGIPVILLIFSSSRGLLESMASFVGIYYAPSLMIPILFGVFFLVSLYFSVKVSKAQERIKVLSQELAILKYTVESNAIETKPKV